MNVYMPNTDDVDHCRDHPIRLRYTSHVGLGQSRSPILIEWLGIGLQNILHPFLLTELECSRNLKCRKLKNMWSILILKDQWKIKCRTRMWNECTCFRNLNGWGWRWIFLFWINTFRKVWYFCSKIDLLSCMKLQIDVMFAVRNEVCDQCINQMTSNDSIDSDSNWNFNLFRL